VADIETGLSPERLSLLSVLAYAGPRTVGELAALEMVSAPAISRTLGALEDQGLIRRVRSRRDRRQVRAHATTAGRELMELGRRSRVERIAADLRRLENDQLTLLVAAMDVLDELTAAQPPTAIAHGSPSALD